MKLPTQRIQLIAGAPIHAGNVRLMPSVLVNTVEQRDARKGVLRFVKLRPISVVVKGPDSAQWLEIPDETQKTLSVMAVAALGVAAVSLFIIVVARMLRRS